MEDPATSIRPLAVTTCATTGAPSPADTPAVQGWTRWLWLALAYISLGIGLVAIVVPGLPTTEFILLAAWAASKGSPRLRGWLERHPVFGVMIHNWQNGRVVARRAKLTASIAMSICLVIMLVFVPNRWVVSIAAIGMAAGAMWMWSRPERVSPQEH